MFCDPGGHAAQDMRPAGIRKRAPTGAQWWGSMSSVISKKMGKNTGNPLRKRDFAVGPEWSGPRGRAHTNRLTVARDVFSVAEK
ncbi:hypothetical protein [Burkholderia sp. Nafp2/4-1b]|uniref:hypothetical protein n=1 Tax=Burkholderia sp. Nafp2/4-1b TaxID=2116686 RepID=UPI0013CEED05|nr:hypothetical protein [Burkholderia sp. Nafp2/4-1b]